MATVTLRTIVNDLVDGQYDGRLTPRKRRQTRRLGRRIATRERAKAFYDELIPQLEKDRRCCAMIAPLAAGDESFDEDTPVEFESEELFEFIDRLLSQIRGRGL